MVVKRRKLISLGDVVVAVVVVVWRTELTGNEISGDSLSEKMCDPSEI